MTAMVAGSGTAVPVNRVTTKRAFIARRLVFPAHNGTMRGLGIPVLTASSLFLWLGFAMVGGWLRLLGQIPGWILMVVAVAGFFWSGFLLNKPLARGFLLPGLGLLADAYLIAAYVPQMINAGSGQDAVDLASWIGSGMCVFFGLALVLAAALTSLMSQK